VMLRKDRAWLHILRREWAAAEADLTEALRSPLADREVRADLFDALASLNRDQRNLAQAVEFAQQALALREELGHLPRIADSFNNLGLLYSAIADHSHALAAFHEALAIYRRIDNRERTALVLLNTGVAHHLAGRLPEAVRAYRECLAICDSDALRLTQVRVLYNLAEALAEGGDSEAALHWSAGLHLAREAAFDDEIRHLQALGERFPQLLREHSPPRAVPPGSVGDMRATSHDGDEQIVLDLLAHAGQITPRSLMAATGISKATATRRLAEMARKGTLHQQGQGRSTIYIAGVAEVGGTQHAVSPPSPEETQITIEIQRLEALLREATLANDATMHEALLADDWLNTNANGTTTSKAQLLQLLREQPFAFVEIRDNEVQIRVYGTTAIVTGRSLRQRKDLHGALISQAVRFSRVYTQINGQWRLVNAQGTLVTSDE
jgi:tetratricopeptide (TPR) repeat protein